MEKVGAARRAVGALAFLVGLAMLVIGLGVFVVAGEFGLAGNVSRLAGLAAVAGGVLMVLGRLLRGADGLEYLADDGLGGRARVGAATAIGRQGSRTVIDLDLVVDVSGRPPYPVRKRALVPADLVAAIQPGADLPVLVDPVHPQRVGVDLIELRAELAAEAAAAPAFR